MRILFTSLLAIYITTEIVSSKTNCPNFTCENKSTTSKVICMKITQPEGLVRYMKMLRCVGLEFKCNVGDQLNIEFVAMSLCNKHLTTRSLHQHSIDEKVPRRMLCPLKCPEPKQKVCARVGKGLYRSFASDCYLDMYLCTNTGIRRCCGCHRWCSSSGMFAHARVNGFPDIMRARCAAALRRLRDSRNSLLAVIADRLDSYLFTHSVQLVSWQACNTSAPYVDDTLPREKALQEPQDYVLDRIDIRKGHSQSNRTEETPITTKNLLWFTRSRKASILPDLAKEQGTTKAKTSVTETTKAKTTRI